jgi:hypothetical protein
VVVGVGVEGLGVCARGVQVELLLVLGGGAVRWSGEGCAATLPSASPARPAQPARLSAHAPACARCLRRVRWSDGEQAPCQRRVRGVRQRGVDEGQADRAGCASARCREDGYPRACGVGEGLGE